jgi:hypothetical protein
MTDSDFCQLLAWYEEQKSLALTVQAKAYLATAGLILDDLKRLRAVLASGIYLPEVDLEGEIEEGWYLAPLKDGAFSVHTATLVVHKWRNRQFFINPILRAWGPIVLPKEVE